VRALRPAIALLCGVLLSCDPATVNGTTLFVSVSWQDGWPLVALRFSGVAQAMPAFATQTRPDVGGPQLHPPQTVRILLNDSLGGEQVDVTAEALQADGGVFARGTASATVVKGREEPLAIALLEESADGGFLDGGCACKTGCCLAGDTRCAKLNGTYFACPNTPGSTCANQCDGQGSDRCSGNSCACGTHSACGNGLRCAVSATAAACVCDERSGCNGCCDSSDSCTLRTAEDNSHCGAGGAVCDNCNGGTCTNGLCSVMPVCAGAMCTSGHTCEGIAFPRCQSGVACFACNPLRSDRCGVVSPCPCGATVAGCMSGQVCVTMADGGAECEPISGG
jgi:hypothetical protein